MNYVSVDPYSLMHERRDGFYVHVDEQQTRADVVLAYPPANCLTPRQFAELRLTFEQLDSNPRVRVIVLRAEDKHFSRFEDAEREPEIASVPPARLVWDINAPLRCSKPVVAANRGHWFGTGFALALACDLRIVTETTQYGFPVKKDDFPGGTFGWSQALQIVGSARMREMLMRSRLIPGVQAFEWGIATDFVVDSDLEEMTDATVRELLDLSPSVQSTIKHVLSDLGEGFEPARTESLDP
ncbi:enoyl-CoA hydratase/isomerase family protein [Burkholderia sp. Ac-20365]|uniref:enoyl-CoA hydratase/isomerase family protein n=1 Tax=Burkholderia sp. Ac-20365 TaxID=2703897 RepID=UPI00197C668A|nr:enoyl-CoA hydratase/isomerase family protein [Burkholderia sp. Ac-20365]MBN3761662.1 enoyl-CoA hydratase/isomerase family protein [Burkholderia sp. Ac-20365]